MEQEKRGRGRPKLIKNTITSPPERLELFMEYYIDGIPAKEAWVKAGYSESHAHQANAKLRENWKILERMIDNRIGSHVPRALAVVVDVMEHASSAQTRLQAAKDLLDRAGKKATTSINISHTDTDKMADTDIDAEIIQLTKKMKLES